MSADTATAGYPAHAVESYSKSTNGHGVGFTDWSASCGARGQLTGSMATFGKAGHARRAELCPVCFPAGFRTYHPEPVEIEMGEQPK